MFVRKAYYSIREILPVDVRRYLQRSYFNGWRKLPFPEWPVDFTVDNLHEEYLRLLMEARGITRIPFIWFWPQGAPSAVILTHDVETAAGRDFTSTLMDIDASRGFRASIQVVPEKRSKCPRATFRRFGTAASNSMSTISTTMETCTASAQSFCAGRRRSTAIFENMTLAGFARERCIEILTGMTLLSFPTICRRRMWRIWNPSAAVVAR